MESAAMIAGRSEKSIFRKRGKGGIGNSMSMRIKDKAERIVIRKACNLLLMKNSFFQYYNGQK